jgi:hypothetical protein
MSLPQEKSNHLAQVLILLGGQTSLGRGEYPSSNGVPAAIYNLGSNTTRTPQESERRVAEGRFERVVMSTYFASTLAGQKLRNIEVLETVKAGIKFASIC